MDSYDSQSGNLRITKTEAVPTQRSHEGARPSLAKSSDDIQQPKPPTKVTAHISHRGTTYTALSDSEQTTVTAGLPHLCHSIDRLSKEGYTLAANKTARTGSSAIPEHDETSSKCASALGSKPIAVVLDCEMAGTSTGGNELIQIAIIDFLSGEVLLQSLVNPTVPITAWRTEITGITAASMKAAVASGAALNGWQAARAELWRVVGPDTILVGQSLYHDLKVLQASHTKIIDTAILAFDAVLGEKLAYRRKRWGLKELCRDLLGINIRQPPRPGTVAVHDAVEDVLATRELVLLFLRNPAKVTAWAYKTKAAYEQDIEGGWANGWQNRSSGFASGRSFHKRPWVGFDDDNDRWNETLYEDQAFMSATPPEWDVDDWMD